MIPGPQGVIQPWPFDPLATRLRNRIVHGYWNIDGETLERPLPMICRG